MPFPSGSAGRLLAETWEAVLDQLEGDLAGAQRVLDAEVTADDAGALRPVPDAWLPPSGLGPLPPELAARAHDLAAAQVELARRLEQARRRAARHLTVLDAVPAAPSPAPVFVDARG
ncbi:hypothetical protein GCM10023258_18270 [Terrabacter aeriphilus]|uniref:Uncharacterized protein n=1 Tax=Terrabacter aeriphilus TaxID=515662 RepID=A0ABP9JC45_9MICO